MDLESSLIAAWMTNSRITEYLVGHLPAPLWSATIPGSPRRTVRSIAAHLHNARCGWIRTLGGEFGITVPKRVDHRAITRRELLSALKKSGRGISSLLRLGCDHGGRIPPTKAYVWRNLPLDVGHVLSYFVAHEAHHRGQIVLVARQLQYRFPAEVAGGLWQFQTRAKKLKRSRGGLTTKRSY